MKFVRVLFVVALMFTLLPATAAHARHDVVTVKRGDTLSKIANRKDAVGGWERVWYRNAEDRGPIKDPNRIKVGWKLTMPHKPRPVFGPRRQQTASRSGTSTGQVRTVESTAYCLTGTMASGKRVYYGAVAENTQSFGTKYKVLSGPEAGTTKTVEDRIGHGSQFDIAFPGNCTAARNYGRRTIRIELLR